MLYTYMLNKSLLISSLAFLLSISLISANHNDDITTFTTPSGIIINVPEQALQNTHATLLSDGRTLERRIHIFYKFNHNPNHNPPGQQGGGGTSSCFAFISNGAKWKTTEQYVLSTSNNDGLSSSFVTSTISTSLDTWDNEVAFDIFGIQDTNSVVDGPDTNSPDNKNEIMLGSISNPGVIAVTIVWGFFGGPPSQREIIEYDMVFDDPDFLWGDAGPTSETSLGNTAIMDFKNIAAHEIGHAAGLSHPSNTCAEETMYTFSQEGETKKRTLNPGDIAGINALY